MTELEIGILSEMNELLDLERAAILRGDIEEVGQLLDQKESYLSTLKGFSDTGAEDFLKLKDKIDRNQSLIANSLRGIRAVADRLATIQKVSDTLEIYDRNGQRKMFNLNRAGKMERRA